MSDAVIVRDDGFGSDDWTGDYVALAEVSGGSAASVDVPSDADVEDLRDQLDTLAMVRVDFPSSADGRGFTLAKRLRLMGYKGRLRARGHVLADQYAMARRSGFDEVEISGDLATRQPEDQWRFRADWAAGDYQARLRG